MSQATARVLRTAAEVLGGEEALAKHLNIGELLMRAYIEERRPLPDFLLLRAVDVVLENINRSQAKPPTTQAVDEAVRELKSRFT
jgi:hypothetical protein